MKNILITLLVFITIGCKAQTIINIKDDNGSTVDGTYYKDVDNVLNEFEGTWVFTESSKTLKLVLSKRVGHYNGFTTSDYLRGGYEYKVNNQILVNTLIDATSNYVGKARYRILGNTVLKNNDLPFCADCIVGENRLRLTFADPVGRIGGVVHGVLIVRKIVINGQEALSVNLMGSSSYYLEGTPPPPDDFIVPSGDYILLKQ